MNRRRINALDAPEPAGGYAQAVEITNASRLLFISGQIPVTTDNVVPTTFTEQGRLAWQNVESQLRAAGMTLDNLVKVTTYLADRCYAMENREVRRAALGDRQVAMTVVIAGIFDTGWLLEIEAIAAD